MWHEVKEKWTLPAGFWKKRSKSRASLIPPMYTSSWNDLVFMRYQLDVECEGWD